MPCTSPFDETSPVCSVEPLEGRRLLSGVAGELAVVLPTVRMFGPPLVIGGTHYTFNLIVRGLGAAFVGADDVIVRGPRGFVSSAKEVRETGATTGTRLITCSVAAPGGTFDRGDNGLYTLWLRRTNVLTAGANDGAAALGRFRVFSRAAPDPSPALPASNRSTIGPLSAELTGVFAWCDHMPVIGPDGGCRYVVLRTVLKNTSDAPLEVRLSRAYVSFEATDVGTETHGISVRGPDGRPSGIKTVVLQPGEERVVQFRGDNVYPEDRHGQRLYVTLEFTAGGATGAVRNSAIVMVTH
jgi:hypothetical protein